MDIATQMATVTLILGRQKIAGSKAGKGKNYKLRE
jgi:hypothetical protein